MHASTVMSQAILDSGTRSFSRSGRLGVARVVHAGWPAAGARACPRALLASGMRDSTTTGHAREPTRSGHVTKSELVEQVAERAQVSRQDAGRAVDAML